MALSTRDEWRCVLLVSGAASVETAGEPGKQPWPVTQPMEQLVREQENIFLYFLTLYCCKCMC